MTAIFLFFMEFFHYLLAVAVIGVLYYISVNPQCVLNGLKFLYLLLQDPWNQYYFAAIAAILLLLELDFFLIKARRNKKSRYIVFEQASGRVALSVHAIEDFIVKVCKGYPEIREIMPKVTTSRKGIEVHLNVCIFSGYNVSVFGEDLKKNIRSQLQNILGLEKSVSVDIRITEVHDEKKEAFRDKLFQGLEIQ
jgi:RNase P/RNase MRP subunit POP5